MTISSNPENVDFLNFGNACNLSCAHCYFVEPVAYKQRDMKKDLTLVQNLIKKYEKSACFIYPMEIATNIETANLFPQIKQASVLSNGVLLNREIITILKNNFVEEIKVTLFSNYREHNFFCKISEEQYELILKNIILCKEMGLRVVVNNVLSKITMKSLPDLAKKCSIAGVDRIELIRLKPTGMAKHLDASILLEESDMAEIIELVEYCKTTHPTLYFGFNMSFGPDFYKKDISQALQKIAKAKNQWTKSNYLCPSIDGNYVGISLRTGLVYSCFFAMDQKEFIRGKINLSDGEITENGNYKLSSLELPDKLRGNCHQDNCEYQKICLGGCRSTACIFAKLRGESSPLFSGMDICITNMKKRMSI